MISVQNDQKGTKMALRWSNLIEEKLHCSHSKSSAESC